MDAKTWREAARQLREEAEGIRIDSDAASDVESKLLSMARRFENEAKVAEKEGANG